MSTDTILHVPAGQWFAPDEITSRGKLITLVQSRYTRHSDGATLETKGQFLFRWQLAKEEENMNTININTINWSYLTPEQRDRLISIYIMNDDIGTPLQPYTQDMNAIWQAVMRFDRAIVTLTHVSNTYHHCRIKLFDEQRAYHGTRLSAPEAIAIALLRACGLEIEHAEEDMITHNMLDK